MKTIKLFILLSALMPFVTVQASSISVSGIISTNTTWTGVDTVKVIGDVTINNLITLTIDPGIIVEFQGHYKLKINGTMLATGTAAERISFTAKNQSEGWNSIVFDTPQLGNDSTKIIYCNLEYGKATTGDHDDKCGGALWINSWDKILIANCRFSNNYAEYNGGAIFIDDGNPKIINSEITNNQANNGGGIYFYANSNSICINNTICNNMSYGGGGICLYDNCDPDFMNTIIYNNTASSGLGPQVKIGNNNTDPNFYFCDIEGGTEAFYIWLGDYTGDYENCIDADPQFVGSGNHPFDISSSSPCINAGDPTTSETDIGAHDQAGNPRFYNGIVDIGAYEEPSAPDQFPGTCLTFDGTDDYISGNGMRDDFSAFTLEAWIYHHSLPAEVQRYISIAPETVVLRYDGSAFGGEGQLHFYIKKADESFSFIRVDNALTTGEWMHIAATYDGTDLKMYLNGELLQTNNVASGLYPLDGGFSLSNSGETLDGKMDEIRLWDRALSSTEIRENMNRTMNGAEAGLQYYWQFNEGTGSTTDIVGGGLPATLHNKAEDDWIDSTIPFGSGYADTETEAIGVVNFTDTGLSMNFSSQTGAEITVTRIDTTANVNPTDPVTVFDEQYWVVNRFGPGAFDVDLTFTISEDLTAEDESDPTLIKLYTRASNADTSWIYLKNADSVSSVNDEVTFNGITEFSQFIVTRWQQFLEVPQNVIISIVSDSVYIYWDSVNGANSYKIYASSDPYASDWGTEIASVSGTIWSADISGIKKQFYSVVASSEIVRNNISDFSNGSKVIPEMLITPRKM